VDECFAGRPPGQRAIYDLLEAHLRALGPLHVDTVRVGVFLKHQRKLAEVRPKSRWLSLEVVLPRPVEDPRVARRERIGPQECGVEIGQRERLPSGQRAQHQLRSCHRNYIELLPAFDAVRCHVFERGSLLAPGGGRPAGESQQLLGLLLVVRLPLA
jgi:hypothetical protein